MAIATRRRRSRVHGKGGMFAITLQPSQDELARLLDPGQKHDPRENGYRSNSRLGDNAEWTQYKTDAEGKVVCELDPDSGQLEPVREEKCPLCGSIAVKSESFGSYGGTTEGYSKCLGQCRYSVSFADISAVI